MLAFDKKKGVITANKGEKSGMGSIKKRYAIV
jgi:hypothetical protein